jgi:hypothetical protein
MINLYHLIATKPRKYITSKTVSDSYQNTTMISLATRKDDGLVKSSSMCMLKNSKHSLKFTMKKQ